MSYTRRRGPISTETDRIAVRSTKQREELELELGRRVRLAIGTENMPRWSGQHRATNARRRADAIAIRGLIGANK